MTPLRPTPRTCTLAVLTLAAALLAGPAPAAAAPAGDLPTGLLDAGGAPRIPGSYIVVLGDGVRGDVAGRARALADRYGGSVTHTWSVALRGFAARLTAAQAQRLSADPAVQYVEPDPVVHAAGAADETQQNPPSWGIDRIDQRALPLSKSYTYRSTAPNVTAYIVDSGINTAHQDFGGRASYGYDFVDNDNTAQDCHGHGSHVAGTVGGATYGVAKGVKLVAVRVLSCSGSGSGSGVLNGVEWVAKNAVKPSVANFSIVGGGSSLEAAIKKSILSGTVWALSANNQSTDACTSSPAKLPEAITVGNVTNADGRAGSSNYGSCLDIWAPGSSIVSASHNNNSGSRTMSGTSMASPHVAGAAALQLAAKPTATAAEVRDALVAAASKVTIGDAKPGSPNLLLNTLGGAAPR
ncbi:S8 family peptidase [Pilimelia anulata]|nr:S8 family peptidase [Pilimelia anulata]